MERNRPSNSDVLRTLGTMLRLVRSVNSRYRTTSDTALTLSDLSVLLQIHRGVNLPSVIARVTRVDPPRITRITDTLVAEGLIVRSEDPDDRRRSRLTVTAEGERRMRKELAAVADAVHEIFKDVPDGVLQALVAAMAEVRVTFGDADDK